MAESRSQHACLGCRQKKIKCMPTSEGGDSCRRCARLDLECEVPEKKQRATKSRLRGRVDQLESSYAQILSLLAERREPQPGALLHVEEAVRDVDSGIAISPESDRHEEEPLLEMSLRVYRRMSAENFPFVVVPEEISAASLSQRRPMLARAIAVATSWDAPSEQSAKRAVFLKGLSSRYFVECERSLDLLQALLVYFGWCQWHAMPFNPQAYRLACLVVSMALELGINERPSDVTQHQMIVQSSSLAGEISEPVSENSLTDELKRAYVGAYTVSMYCSFFFRKPSPLAYTPYLHECASSISAKGCQPSDRMMIHYLSSLRIGDDVTKSFDHGSSETMQEMHDGRIQILLKALTRQLNDWREALPASTLNDEKLTRQILLSRAYIHEVGLYHLLQGQTPSISRIEILLECFNSTRDYLDAVLALPAESMLDWNCMNWRSLNYAVMVNSKAATIIDSFCYCSESSQRAVWVDNCYDALCSRVEMLGRMVDPSAEDCFLTRLSVDWANAKSYYYQGVRQAAVQTTPASVVAPEGPQFQDQFFDVDNLYNMTWSTFGGDGDWTNQWRGPQRQL